jgi:hypothetical protein
MNFLDADGTRFTYNKDSGCIINEDNDDDVIALASKADCDDLLGFIQWVKDQISE